MDETLMTYLRTSFHWSRRYMLRRVDDVPEMKKPAKPRREAGQKTESSRSGTNRCGCCCTAYGCVIR